MRLDMKLNKLVRHITREEAVNFVANGSQNIVAVLQNELNVTIKLDFSY